MDPATSFASSCKIIQEKKSSFLIKWGLFWATATSIMCGDGNTAI
jgi:hypothetical protein